MVRLEAWVRITATRNTARTNASSVRFLYIWLWLFASIKPQYNSGFGPRSNLCLCGACSNFVVIMPREITVACADIACTVLICNVWISMSCECTVD